MKHIHIDFSPKSAWRWIWGITIVLVTLSILITMYHWRQTSKVTDVAEDKLTNVTLELAKQYQPSGKSTEAKEASLVQIGELLSRNFNQAFNAAENMTEQGAQLKSLSYDAVAYTLRLEYDLDSMAKVSAITAHLNSGRDTKPWKLDSASLSDASTLNTAAKVRVKRNV